MYFSNFAKLKTDRSLPRPHVQIWTDVTFKNKFHNPLCPSEKTYICRETHKTLEAVKYAQWNIEKALQEILYLL